MDPTNLPPYRIACVENEIVASDPALVPIAKLLLFVALFEATVRHPQLAVTDPDDVGVQAIDGAFVPVHALRVPAMEAQAFGVDRRDELIWLELSLASASAVRLRCKRADGREESFDALGGDVGGAIGSCLNAWLSARGLAPLAATFPSFTRDDLLAAVRCIAPALQQRAAALPRGWATPSLVEERAPEVDVAVDLDGGAPSTVDEDEDEEEVEVGEGIAPRAFAELGLPLPAVLTTAALRTYGIVFDAPVHEEILARDPDSPGALRDRFFATLPRGRDFALLRRLIALAPAWGKPYLSLLHEDEDDEADDASGAPSEDEALAAAGWAAVCIPANEYALEGYAESLSDADRDAEALRWRGRRLVVEEDDPAAWKAYLATLRECDLVGRYLIEAELAGKRFDGCSAIASFFGADPDHLHLDLEASTAYLNCGRIGEAIALRENRLHGLESSWRNNVEVTNQWKKSPNLLAQCYAREGWFRGDDGRVLEGFGRGAPGDGLDLAMFIDSLVAAGKPSDAAYAYAELGRGRGRLTATTRIAAARALLLAGDVRRGLVELQLVALRYPHHDLDAAACHVLRLLPSVPADALTAVVADFTSAGAKRLARLVARDIADFVPSLARHPAIAGALGRPADRATAVPGTGDLPCPTVQRLFDDAAKSQGALADGDGLVDGWASALHADVDATERVALARATAYVLARALAGYLSGIGPSFAYRTVASEALLAVAYVSDALTIADVASVLAVVEHALPDVDVDLARTWLVRVEDALRIEERTRGRLDTVTAGLPEVARLLMTPERVAVIEHTLARLRRDRPGGWEKSALPLYEAHFFASGGDLAGEHTDAAKGALAPDDALDVHLLCAFVTAGWSAGPCVNAAEVYLGRGDGDRALAVLAEGLGAAGEDWRDEQLVKLKPLWKKAKVDVPFEFKKAANVVFESLQAGDPAKAVRAGRWICALDEDNKEAQRNLGLAYAGAGQVLEAIEALSKADPAQGMQICAGVLLQGGRTSDAMQVIDYASRWFTRADQWLTMGGIAYQAMDNPRTVRAYRNAWALDPDAFDVSMLNGYAGVLDEVGEYETCAVVAKKQEKLAGSDMMWKSCAWYNQACALVGTGRFDEALPLAKKAVDKNPLPDNTENFAKTLERAKKKHRPDAPPPLVLEEGGLRAKWLEGDVRVVTEAASAPDAPADTLRLAVRAARFRYDSERYVRSTPRMTETANDVLARTRGAIASDAILARTFALDLRAEASFPRDPLPPLGDRMTRAEFYRLFRARGGVVLGDAVDEPRTFTDREVASGTKAPRITDYARLLGRLRDEGPVQGLASFGIDPSEYRALTSTWAEAMAKDDALKRDVETALLV